VQVIVFAGGVNDFAAGAPNETWWVNGYATFIQNVSFHPTPIDPLPCTHHVFMRI
jgi:hypothetical protein